MTKAKKNGAQKIMLIVALVVIGFILLLVVRAVYVLYSVGSFKKAWMATISAPAADDSLVLVALGDSTVQGIGGFKKEDGFVGQVAKRISRKTGKNVQVYNFSVTGAESGEVLERQIPQFKKLKRVDAVIVAVGPNDITHKKSLDSFLKNYEEILKQLPSEKTVISNMPPMGPKDTEGRSSYDWSRALRPLAQKYDVILAPVYENIKPRANDFRTYGGDFYHPSKAGYKLWADAFTPPIEKILSKS